MRPVISAFSERSRRRAWGGGHLSLDRMQWGHEVMTSGAAVSGNCRKARGALAGCLFQQRDLWRKISCIQTCNIGASKVPGAKSWHHCQHWFPWGSTTLESEKDYLLMLCPVQHLKEKKIPAENSFKLLTQSRTLKKSVKFLDALQRIKIHMRYIFSSQRAVSKFLQDSHIYLVWFSR